jgi:hypothetical protein
VVAVKVHAELFAAALNKREQGDRFLILADF